MARTDWDLRYTGHAPTSWDIGRPQSAFVRLAYKGLLRGRVLDVGCGTGEHVLLAAMRGGNAMGIDISPTAVEQARGKAASRGIAARFEVADAMRLGEFGAFDTLIDIGLFHNLDDDARAPYVSSLAAALRPGGHCYLLCFSDRYPGTLGPRRIRQDEIRDAFRDGWTVVSIKPDTFELKAGFGTTTAQAWLAAIRRL
jgi:cyclopropane fatty-acyl-phospholipid synthase-like methyltransferase